MYIYVYSIYAYVYVCMYIHCPLIIVLQVICLNWGQGKKPDYCSGHCKVYIFLYLFLIMKRTESSISPMTHQYLTTINILLYLLLLLLNSKSTGRAKAAPLGSLPCPFPRADYSLGVCTPPSPGGADGKESTCNSAGDLGSIPRSGRFSGEGNLHPCILAWRIPGTEEPGGGYIVHRVTKSWT